MSREQVLYQSPMLHRLLRAEDGGLFLEVVVGGISQHEVRVRLNDDEVAALAREGHAFIDRLARDVLANPSFHGRAVRP